MKEVLVYGGGTMRECCDFATEILKHIHEAGIYSTVFRRSNAEIKTSNVHILVRTDSEHHIRGRRADEVFGYPSNIAAIIRRNHSPVDYEGNLLDYIIENEKEVKTMKPNTVDTILVSKSTDILVVGRKQPNESVEIINAFQGEEAEELYKRLVEKKRSDISG